jgi:hypothetical protein
MATKKVKPVFCKVCVKKPLCKKICKELEKYLRHLQAKKGYSDAYYKSKTILWDGNKIEDLATQVAFWKEKSWRVNREYHED